jgi:hypothetical protein
MVFMGLDSKQVAWYTDLSGRYARKIPLLSGSEGLVRRRTDRREITGTVSTDSTRHPVPYLTALLRGPEEAERRVTGEPCWRKAEDGSYEQEKA